MTYEKAGVSSTRLCRFGASDGLGSGATGEAARFLDQVELELLGRWPATISSGVRWQSFRAVTLAAVDLATRGSVTWVAVVSLD